MGLVEFIRVMYETIAIGNDVLMALTGFEIAGIIGAAVAAVASATEGGIAAKRANDARRTEEKNRAEIEAEQRRRENLFNRRYHQDMTDRTEVQGMLRELREQQDAQRGLNEAQDATLGATKAQQLAEQNSLNKSFAEGVAGMTRNASTLKDGYLDRYEGSLADYYRQRREANTRSAQMQQQSSNMAAVAASNAMNAAANMGVAAAGAMDNGGVKKAPTAPQGGTMGVQNPNLQVTTPVGNNGLQMNPDGTIVNKNGFEQKLLDYVGEDKLKRPWTPRRGQVYGYNW